MSDGTRGGIEDIYPLTPLQTGMLYHSLRAEEPGAYTEQFVFECTTEPPARPPRADTLGAAWQAVVRRHPVLRTGFVWEEVETPVQVVASSCTMPVEELDLTGLSPEETEAGVEEFLAADRARGFDLARPPLTRLAVLRARDRTFLVWTVHHLVIDGWSMPKILAEVGAVHRAGGVDAAALPEVRPFRSYVDWLDRQDDEAAARFWKDRLGTLPPADRLVLRPGDARERRGRAAAGSAEHELPEALSATVREAARAAQVSLSTWFQGAWAVALSHIGPGPQVFGVTVASRPPDLPGADGIVGPCINTVVQRLDASDGGTLRDWLRGIQRGQTAALPHQHLGIPEVRRACGGVAEAPPFETIVAFENYPDQGTFLDLGPGTSVTLWRYVEDTTYPLTFVVLPGERALGLRLFYDPARFGPEEIRTVLGRVEAAVTAMAAGPDEPVSAVRESSARPSVARGPARTRTGDGPAALAAMPLHDIVARQAARTPDAPAVDDHGRVCGYAELDARAARLATRLGALGAGRDTVVALLLRRSTRALVGILGVLKAGAAYLALDPDHPDERLEFLLADSGAAVLVTEEGTHDRLPGAGPPRLRADLDGPEATGGTPAVPPGSGSVPEDLCYVTYTSGSTGRPKGVAMQHGVVAGMLAWELAHGSVPSPARTLAQVSFTFDVSAQEIFTAWGGGGCLVLADEEDRTDFERLVALVRDREVQRWYMSPTALGQVAAAADRTGVRLPRLREIMTAGEPLEVTGPVRRLLDGPEARVRLENQYGSSECQVVSSLRLTGDPGDHPARPGVGSPIDGVDLYVLDEAWRPVAVGVPGMICVGGAAVPRGYLGRPGATAERLLPDPLAARPGSRMYVTGDLGVLHADGTLECLGRADDQVKIRGHRVEPGEVRAALRHLPGVRDAAVVVRELAGERRLIGYVVPSGIPSDGAGPRDWAEAEARLRSALREKLPAPFVPWRVVRLPALPVTTSGKVDRGALPDPEPPRRASPVAASGERPALEAMLRLWEDVLPTGRVEPDADFLALGGESLLAIRLTGRIRNVFSVGLGVSRLMRVRTPRALLAEVDAELGAAAASDRAALAHLRGRPTSAPDTEPATPPPDAAPPHRAPRTTGDIPVPTGDRS
ncbi:non-ribosomal peptide synthetase [Streptomyces sp. OE57]|uniref:non-ribosomal peptide synthetase n=1 Tax=Streptomyces lacaronensis TaxID=3379885 RepID=UPI0039B7887E